jgi:hypothetical protein
MRERSHKKGETYQQDVKHWLSRAGFLSFEAELFGDAYDVTKKACTIGGCVFDFSLRLGRGEVARHILYGECKYRNEQRGSVNADFKAFLGRVYGALAAADGDDADSAVFVFVSTVPPDDWRRFLQNKLAYCRAELVTNLGRAPDETLLAKLVGVVYVLALSAPIIARR